MVNFFIERPIFASAIAIIMVLAGLIAYFNLPVEQFPQVTPPQVVVKSTYTGASAQVVADAVTTPLEEQINGAQGMIYISSVSANDGTSTITVTFNIGYDVDIGAVDVQNRVSQATAQLAEHRQSVRHHHREAESEFHPGGEPLFARRLDRSRHAQQLRLSSARRSAEAPARRERRHHLRRAPLFHAHLARSEQACQARPDRDRRPERDCRAERPGRGRQVRRGAGAARAPTFQYQINAQGQLADRNSSANIVLRAGTTSDAAVYLRDVARTDLGALQYTSSASVDEHPAVLLAVFQLPTANALELDKSVKATMAGLAKRFPKGMTWAVTYDTTMFVSASMTEVVKTLGHRAGAGARGGVPVPAELADHAHPDDRHPGGADRHPRGHAGAGLLAQHRQHARHGPGDRPRRRRCDRRGGERRTPARKRACADGRRQGGDEGSDGPHRRHLGGARRRVRADRLPAGHHRAALQPVRA